MDAGLRSKESRQCVLTGTMALMNARMSGIGRSFRPIALIYHAIWLSPSPGETYPFRDWVHPSCLMDLPMRPHGHALQPKGWSHPVVTGISQAEAHTHEG